MGDGETAQEPPVVYEYASQTRTRLGVEAILARSEWGIMGSPAGRHLIGAKDEKIHDEEEEMTTQEDVEAE